MSLFNTVFEDYSDYVADWEGGHGYDDVNKPETETNRGIQIGTWRTYAPLVGLNPSHEAFMAMTEADAKKIKDYMWGQFTGGLYDPRRQIIAVEMVWSGGNNFWLWLKHSHPEYSTELGGLTQKEINNWISNHSVNKWYDLFKEYITVHLAGLYAQYPGWGYRWGFVPLTEYHKKNGQINILQLFNKVLIRRITFISGIGLGTVGIVAIIYYFWDSIQKTFISKR